MVESARQVLQLLNARRSHAKTTRAGASKGLLAVEAAHEAPVVAFVGEGDRPRLRRAGDVAAGGGAHREPVDDLRERAPAGDEDAPEVEHLDALCDLRAAGDPLGELAPPGGAERAQGRGRVD